MYIAGIGAVFSRGRGINQFEEALKQGWVPPLQNESSFLSGKKIPVYRVDKEIITDKINLKKMRRADRFSKMATIAACDAFYDGGLSLEKTANLGIIVATAFGPHSTTFRFLDDIIDYSDAGVSPIIFSHSVHNAAASYIASALKSNGPVLTVTQFYFSFHQALILAQAWIREGRCDHVLVGSVDECGQVMEYICAKKLKIALDGKIKPFNFSASPVAVPGEGSIFFIISGSNSLNKYCQITDVIINNNTLNNNKPDMYILDADGMIKNETAYKNIASTGVMLAGYSPVFGSMMTGSAFNCAAAALMLKKQIIYASPQQENKYAVNICKKTKKTMISSIDCVKHDCIDKKAIIKLKKTG